MVSTSIFWAWQRLVVTNPRQNRALRSASATTLYADCNAVSPRTVRAIAEVITAAGSRFVDAGIIGSPPRKEGTTRFYASGPDVEEFAELGRYGLDVRPLGLEIG